MKTAERVKWIIEEHLGLDPGQASDLCHLNDDLGADSLDGIEIIMAIEGEFDLEISDEEAEKVGFVVSDIVAAVEALI
jgi:acyl carrier protein